MTYRDKLIQVKETVIKAFDDGTIDGWEYIFQMNNIDSILTRYPLDDVFNMSEYIEKKDDK